MANGVMMDHTVGLSKFANLFAPVILYIISSEFYKKKLIAKPPNLTLPY